jgi:hypothetical protein
MWSNHANVDAFITMRAISKGFYSMIDGALSILDIGYVHFVYDVRNETAFYGVAPASS